jgi:hypothetical protein
LRTEKLVTHVSHSLCTHAWSSYLSSIEDRKKIVTHLPKPDVLMPGALTCLNWGQKNLSHTYPTPRLNQGMQMIRLVTVSVLNGKVPSRDCNLTDDRPVNK